MILDQFGREVRRAKHPCGFVAAPETKTPKQQTHRPADAIASTELRAKRPTNMHTLPRYRCHKEVSALKIKEIRRVEEPVFTRPVCKGCAALGSACGHCERCTWRAEHGNPGYDLVPEDPRYAPITVEAFWVVKHDPKPGGYYVVYDGDGQLQTNAYRSWSPGPVFEAGYTLIA